MIRGYLVLTGAYDKGLSSTWYSLGIVIRGYFVLSAHRLTGVRLLSTHKGWAGQ